MVENLLSAPVCILFFGTCSREEQCSYDFISDKEGSIVAYDTEPDDIF